MIVDAPVRSVAGGDLPASPVDSRLGPRRDVRRQWGRVARYVAIGLIALSPVSCRGADSSTTGPSDGEPALSSITVAPEEASVEETATIEFSVTSDEVGQDSLESLVSWSSSDTSVATVSGEGIATGRSGGSVDIVASAGGASDTSHLDVVAVAAFSDGFESGDYSQVENGWEWSGGVNDAVTSERSHSGSYSMRLSFPAKADGEDAVAQKDLMAVGRSNTGPGDGGSVCQDCSRVHEFWIEYWLYVPSNYHHRTQSSSANNKFFQFWNFSRSDYTDRVRGVPTLWPNGDGTSELTIPTEESDNTFTPHFTLSEQFLGTDSDLGQWVRIRWHVRPESSVGAGDEIIELWKGETLVYSGPQERGEFVSESGYNWFNAFRFWGWANSGWDEATDLYIDDVKLYDSSPGW